MYRAHNFADYTFCSPSPPPPCIELTVGRLVIGVDVLTDSEMSGHDTTAKSSSVVAGSDPEPDRRRFLPVGEALSSAGVIGNGNTLITKSGEDPTDTDRVYSFDVAASIDASKRKYEVGKSRQDGADGSGAGGEVA